MLDTLLARSDILTSSFDGTFVYRTLERRHAERVLLRPQPAIDLDDHQGPLTGRKIAKLGYRITNALRALGLQRNERVLVAKANHCDYLLYMLSVLGAGGLPVSVNRATGWPFITKVQKLTNASYLITDEDTLRKNGSGPDLRALLESDVTILVVSREFVGFRAVAMGAPRVKHFHECILAASAAPPPNRELGADTPVAVFHTSGTTGTPKCCVWNRQNVERIWRIMSLTLPVASGTRCLMPIPFSHALYFALGIGALLSGADIDAPSHFDPQDLLELIERRRTSHVMAFPHVYMRLASEELEARDLSSVRLWSTGADKAHAAHIEKLISTSTRRTRGSLFLDSYGSTEIGAGGIMQVWRTGSAPEPCVQGRPLPTQFRYRITDANWQDVPHGTPGRILVDSTTHFAGYWNNHEAWAQSRVDGYWWGGDIGRVDARGRLVFLDRDADVVRTPEGDLYSLPFEERLLFHPRVMEAAVFDANGQAAACVVPKGWVQPGDGHYLRADSRASLERELLLFANRGVRAPKLSAVRLVSLAEIPIGVTGKVLKRVLRQTHAQRGTAA